MTTPPFNPRTDATAAVEAGWLRPGERLVWTRPSHDPSFEVPGRARSGKVLKQTPWRTVGRRALTVADGAVSLLDFVVGEASIDPSRPEIRVFGTFTDCQAATLAETHSRTSFWVLTDRRFAHVRGQDGALHTDWELPGGRFGYQPDLRFKRVSYERFTFPDGSIIDFRRR